MRNLILAELLRFGRMKFPYLIGMQVQLEAGISASSKSGGLHLSALSFTSNVHPFSSFSINS
jgi:hypothetical protein